MIQINITGKEHIDYCKECESMNDHIGVLCVATNYIDDENFYNAVDKLFDLDRKINKSKEEQDEMLKLREELNKHYTVCIQTKR